MDGNGRWAKQRGKERYEGHIAGVESVRSSVKAAVRNGVKWLTLYAFSTENWGRPAAEVDAIMALFCKTVMGEAKELREQGVRVKIMGERSRFSEEVLQMIRYIEETTADAERLGKELNAKEFWCVHMSHKIPWDYAYGASDMQTWTL